MELSEFIKTTLVEIINGVEDAIGETAGGNGRAVINPTASHANHADPERVQFDVALTVKNTAASSGDRASVRVAEIELAGEQREMATHHEAISRVSFAIPVAWPSVAKRQYDNTGAGVVRTSRARMEGF